MAITERPETLYVVETLREECLKIKRANTPAKGGAPYLTDVVSAVRPQFHWEDLASLLELRRPAWAIWPVGIGHAPSSQNTTMGRRFTLRVLFVGVVDAGGTGANGQDRALAMLDDLHRMLSSNPGRDRPSGAGNANPYGINTSGEGAMPITFDYHKDMNGHGVCTVSAVYDVEIRAPY